jgi:hypothetical protein
MAHKKDKPGKWIKSTVALPSGHGWTCKTGNELFVADRGAVAFEFPKGWVVRHDQPDTLTLHDVPPPADQARISLTIFRLPPVEGGWEQLPLDQLMLASQKARDDEANIVIQRVSRTDLELVWAEKSPYPDPESGKSIRCRQIFARARGVQVLITFDVYADAAEKFSQAWNDLLETLRVGVPRDITGRVGN